MGCFWEAFTPEEVEEETVNERDQYDGLPRRRHFSNSCQFVFSLIGYCVSFSNFWLFPYLCYKNGGGTFIICYIVVSMTVGIPYFFLELALGQYMQIGILGVWQICPLFKGVGWSLILISFYDTIYHIVILAWALLYLFKSFQWELPWKNCDNEWNTIDCVPASCKGQGCFNTSSNVSSAKEYWKKRILQITDRIEDIGTMQWELVGTLFLMWVFVYLSLWKSIKWTARVTYVTVVVPYILFIILLISVPFLEGAENGIKVYLTPDFAKFIEAQVWYEAMMHVLHSLGVGYGTLAVLGSYNDYHNNIYWQCLLVAAIDFLSSFFIGFVVFSSIGYLSKVQQKPIEYIIKSGFDLAFVIYPSVVLELSFSAVWSILLFVAVITLGIDSQFWIFEGLLKALQDEFHYRIIQKRKVFYLIMCLIHFVCGLIYVTQGGMYFHHLTERFAVAEWSIFTTVLCEGCAIAYVYGVNNFYLDMEDMFGFRPLIWWKICWVAISPAILLALIFAQLMTYTPPHYEEYYFPPWARKLGWLLSGSSVVCIPLYMFYCISVKKGNFGKRLKDSAIPTYELCSPEISRSIEESESQESESQESETQVRETHERETQERETQERETQAIETQERETEEIETQEHETQESETQEVNKL